MAPEIQSVKHYAIIKRKGAKLKIYKNCKKVFSSGNKLYKHIKKTLYY